MIAFDSASLGIKATVTGNDNDGIGVDMIVQALDVLALLALVLTFRQYWTDTVIITGTDVMFHLQFCTLKWKQHTYRWAGQIIATFAIKQSSPLGALQWRPSDNPNWWKCCRRQ